MSRIDPSRQVSMSAARAGLPAFRGGLNINQGFEKHRFGRFSWITSHIIYSPVWAPYIFPGICPAWLGFGLGPGPARAQRARHSKILPPRQDSDYLDKTPTT